MMLLSCLSRKGIQGFGEVKCALQGHASQDRATEEPAVALVPKLWLQNLLLVPCAYYIHLPCLLSGCLNLS